MRDSQLLKTIVCLVLAAVLPTLTVVLPTKVVNNIDGAPYQSGELNIDGAPYQSGELNIDGAPYQSGEHNIDGAPYQSGEYIFNWLYIKVM